MGTLSSDSEVESNIGTQKDDLKYHGVSVVEGYGRILSMAAI